MIKQKDLYVSPSVETVEVLLEDSILASSITGGTEEGSIITGDWDI